MTRFRRAAALAFAACALASSAARAATETHETGRDVRIVVESDGSAVVDETTHVRLLASGWKGLDVANVEADAVPEPDATITSFDGASFVAHLAAVPPSALHVDPVDAKAIKKGDYAIHFRYRTQLVDSHEVTHDGAMWRVSWTSPPAYEGVDSARVVFDFPAAPTEPSAAGPSTDGPEAAEFLSTLRRGSDRDELELVRLHVARGESITWSARIDPKALSAVHDPTLRPPPAPRAKEIENPLARFGGAWRALFAIVFGGAFFVAAVARARDAYATKSSLKSLIFVHPMIAALLAAITYASGVWLLLTGSTRVATLVFAAAAIAAMLRLKRTKPAPRGPGAWKKLPEDALFGKTEAASLFDLGTARGKIALAVLVVVTLVVSVALRPIDENAWLAVAPMAAPWLSFWLSASLRHQPNASAAARQLRGIFRALRRSGARVAPWGRIPIGRTDIDDLRLLIVPDAALPGLVGIEIAVGWLGCAGGFTPRFELFVRAREATAAAAKMGSLSRAVKAVTGRHPEERVYLLEPLDFSSASVVALALASVRELVDRRLVEPPSSWVGSERRKAIPPANLEARAA